MLTWMADVLRAAGLPVIEVPGWRTRGHGAMGDVAGVLCHHTAGAARGDGRIGSFVVPGYPSLGIVVTGRPGLAGPLANLGLTRAGVWVTIAAGQGWHAGTGGVPWCSSNGNARLIGVEAESVGTRDDWTPQQRESYPRGCAALLRHLDLGPYRAIGHKEWAPSRKIDPAFWDMAAFRANVARWMNSQEDDMFTDQDRALLGQLARRGDVGFARDQILTALGEVDPLQAPVKRTPEQAAAIAPARRVDVGYARDQLVTKVDALDAKVTALIDLLTRAAAPASADKKGPST